MATSWTEGRDRKNNSLLSASPSAKDCTDLFFFDLGLLIHVYHEFILITKL
jgi:hypothetical protein